jgi:SNF2 family DNA or RNA helicase
MNERDLHPYQIEAVEHILNHTHCGLFLEMGLGKTVSTLTAINKLMYEDLEINKVLIIAPKRVAENVWDAEINKWDHLHNLRISKVTGDYKSRAYALKTDADIYIIGRDNVAWLCDTYGGKKMPFDMLVIDELSSFKNPKSIRFKSLRKIQPIFSRVVGLTGTPAPNGLIDLWSQIYLLDRGERLGKFLTRYRDEYFKPGKRNGAVIYSYVLRSGSEERIHDKIKDICMSMKAKDYLTLPEKMINIVPVVFDDKLKQSYRAFEQEQVLALVKDGVEITALSAATLSNKLLQFANGAIYDENHIVHQVHDLKIEAVKELLDDANGNPVLIAWTYRHDRDRLMDALKSYRPRELKDSKDIEDWNEGLIQVMLMHPASGGHGLNLQAGGHIIIWFGQTWSLELEQQFNARLHRQGQDKPVIINKIIAVGTMDEEVVMAIKDKDSRQDRLMEAVQARIKKYASLAQI